MHMILLIVSIFAFAIWFIVLILPWRPWLNGETLEPASSGLAEFDGLTVVIPARNEADVIVETLNGLALQGSRLNVILVDDGSSDGTAACARQVKELDLAIIDSQALPKGWSGKLWALEQGTQAVSTPWTLLLDADITLAPGMVAALLGKAKQDDRQMVSIMASLRMDSFWERLLIPAFIYFFKLIYPFRWVNSKHPLIAAAAGGCILLETRLIAEMGGFAAIRGAIIDDCTLAKQVKSRGHRIWLGQSHAVVSSRRYEGLQPIWDMVARCAFTQLHYSAGLLGLLSLLLISLYLGPVIGVAWGDGPVQAWALAASLIMMVTYWPTLRYYGLNGAWVLTLPLIGILYLGMAWSSAWRYWRGVRSQWKNRVYAVEE